MPKKLRESLTRVRSALYYFDDLNSTDFQCGNPDKNLNLNETNNSNESFGTSDETIHQSDSCILGLGQIKHPKKSEQIYPEIIDLQGNYIKINKRRNSEDLCKQNMSIFDNQADFTPRIFKEKKLME